MEMKILKREHKLCPCCMKEHEVQTVLIADSVTFKNTKVNYDGTYEYCSLAEELYMNEDQISGNDLTMKDAYRKAQNLLTSSEIRNIREKYGISQADLCILLGWGEKTITRYEGHQVQDKAHDTILKKINDDPEWFLSLLQDAKDYIPAQSYQKYRNAAIILYENDQEVYLRKAIKARYLKSQRNPLSTGNVTLSFQMKLNDLKAEGREEGRVEGREREKKETAMRVYQKLNSAEDAACFADVTVKQVEKWLKEDGVMV